MGSPGSSAGNASDRLPVDFDAVAGPQVLNERAPHTGALLGKDLLFEARFLFGEIFRVES